MRIAMEASSTATGLCLTQARAVRMGIVLYALVVVATALLPRMLAG
jgi:hypothetical protein